MKVIAQETLFSLLIPDYDRGLLFWKARPREWFTSDRIWKSWNSRFEGTQACTSLTTHGYFIGRILWETMLAHRVLWKMRYNTDPGELDHINRIRTDNRIENLRASTRSENNLNRRMHTLAESGHVGVYISDDVWIAQIKRNGKAVHLGRFETVKEAVAARIGAEAALAKL